MCRSALKTERWKRVAGFAVTSDRLQSMPWKVIDDPGLRDCHCILCVLAWMVAPLRLINFHEPGGFPCE